MIFAKNFARNYEKKIILGTSDAWSMSRLSKRPSDPAYYIEDCRIFEDCQILDLTVLIYILWSWANWSETRVGATHI